MRFKDTDMGIDFEATGTSLLADKNSRSQLFVDGVTTDTSSYEVPSLFATQLAAAPIINTIKNRGAHAPVGLGKKPPFNLSASLGDVIFNALGNVTQPFENLDLENKIAEAQEKLSQKITERTARVSSLLKSLALKMDSTAGQIRDSAAKFLPAKPASNFFAPAEPIVDTSAEKKTIGSIAAGLFLKDISAKASTVEVTEETTAVPFITLKEKRANFGETYLGEPALEPLATISNHPSVSDRLNIKTATLAEIDRDSFDFAKLTPMKTEDDINAELDIPDIAGVREQSPTDVPQTVKDSLRGPSIIERFASRATVLSSAGQNLIDKALIGMAEAATGLQKPAPKVSVSEPTAPLLKTSTERQPSLSERAQKVGSWFRTKSDAISKHSPNLAVNAGVIAALALTLTGAVALESLQKDTTQLVAAQQILKAPIVSATPKADVQMPTALEKAIAVIKSNPDISARVQRSLDAASKGHNYGKLDIAYYLNNGIGGVAVDKALARELATELSNDGYKRADAFLDQLDNSSYATSSAKITHTYTDTVVPDAVKDTASGLTDTTVTDTTTTNTGASVPASSVQTDKLDTGITKQILSNGRTVYRGADGRFVSAAKIFNAAAANAPAMDSEPVGVVPASAPAIAQQAAKCEVVTPSIGYCKSNKKNMGANDYITAVDHTTKQEARIWVKDLAPGQTVKTDDVTLGLFRYKTLTDAFAAPVVIAQKTPAQEAPVTASNDRAPQLLARNPS